MALIPSPPLSGLPSEAELPVRADFPGDWNSPTTIFDTERAAKILDDTALACLRSLHGEARRNLAFARFLERAPAACVILMLTGALFLAWAASADGAGLKASFAWAALMLLGIVAMIRLHIRGFARSLRRTPLVEAASDLRQLLLYIGAVWGGGAFLIMPDLPAPALVFSFAVLPSLGLALTLRDAEGFAAFATPTGLLTASATLLGAWPLAVWVTGAILASMASLGLGFFWRRREALRPIPHASAF